MGGVFNLGMAMEGHCSCFKKLAPDDDENCESGLVHVLIFVTSAVPGGQDRLGERQANDVVLSLPPGSRTKH